MRTFKKKALSALLVICMLFGMVSPMTVQAAEDNQASRTVYLSDIEWKSATEGCGDNPIQLDKGYGGGKLTLLVDGAEKTFEKGIGTHATSQIVYDIKGKGYTSFEAYAGVDRAVLSDHTNNSAEGYIDSFSVLIDGETAAATTSAMEPDLDAWHVTVEIPEDAETLTLKCTAGEETWSDHADWADAKFTQTYPDPENVALASKGAKAKAYVNPSNGDDYEYNAASFGGNTDSTVQITNINDGVKNSSDAGYYFDFGRDSEKNSIYLELDLGKSYELANVGLWRYWLDNRTYDATVVAVSDDADFSDSTIIYNSDTNNVHGLGAGSDAKYQESSSGKTFAVPAGTTAQYVRVYTYGVYNGGNTNHVIELEVNAYVWPEGSDGDTDEPENYENPFENAETPLELEGPGTNGEVVHPDVVVFDEPWNGYTFWMGYTPNKTGTSFYENPCIAASNDEVNWEVPDGVTNPIQPRFDSAYQNELEHNCDTDLLYDEVNDRLIIYWEWAQDEAVTGSGHRSEIRYRVSYDGINWGVPVEGTRTVTTGDRAYGVALATDGERYSDLSPTFLYDAEEGIYKVWANDAGNTGYNNPTKQVWYLESEDPLCFSEERVKANQGRIYVTNLLGKDEDGIQMLPWHLDVQWIPEMEEYWAIVQAFPNTGNPDNSSVRLSKSTDGINWTPMVDKTTGNSKPILSPAESGQWDDGQIYRTTFWYEPAENGAKNGGTLHLWYSALSDKNGATGQHWEIGYTSANYRDAMAYLTGTKPELSGAGRIVIDNEHPLLIIPVYGEVYDPNGSTFAWGDTLLGRWNSVPDELKPYTVLELHVGGYIGLGRDSRDNGDRNNCKYFYEQQLEIAQENDIPVMIMVATAGQQSIYTSTVSLDNEWLDWAMKEYDCLKGFFITENYWTSWNRVATQAADFMRIAHENDGYVIWSEHHTDVLQGIMQNQTFTDALELYGDSFAFTWKNTPASSAQNAGSAALIQGLWLNGNIDQWGGLPDSWKWWELGLWKLFETGRAPYSGDEQGEEARTVVMEPEAMLGMEMLSIYANGGTIYNFEHPGYVYGSYDLASPAFTNVVAKTFEWILDNPAPAREEVLEDTEVILHGNVPNNFYTGLTSDNQSSPTYKTGRYGLAPTIPGSVAVDSSVADKVVEYSSVSGDKVAFYNNYYDETYTGNAFAQEVDGKWILYNNLFNARGTQNAAVDVSGVNVDVEMTEHTFTIMERAGSTIDVYLNDYRVNKDSVWEGVVASTTNWNTDVNTLMQDWVRDWYCNDAKRADGEDTYRTTVYTLTGLSQAPTVNVTEVQDDSAKEPVVEYADGTATITIENNGYMNFTIIIDDSDIPQPPVEPTEKEVKSIAVRTAPKTSYLVGESFTATGLVLNVTYTDDTTGTVTYKSSTADEFSFAPDGALTLDDASVTITYKGATAVLPITVAEPEPEPEPGDTMFVFPTQLNETKTLEAEVMELHNTGTNEAWPLQLSEASWASGGKFVNAMNTGDSGTIYYEAPVAGKYQVVITFRSGDSRNALSWSETDGKITAGSTTAGYDDEARATHTATTTFEVVTAGKGTLTIAAGTYNAPQMDKFDITLIEAYGETPQPPVEPTEKEVKSIAVKTAPKTSYLAGESFAPEGLELEITYTDDSTETVAYTTETADEFGFAPEGVLTVEDTAVTITYGGKTTELEITVVENVEPPVEEEGEVVRISGKDRYATGYKAAEALKEAFGVDKFDAVVVATGKNFADALSGSYLAIVKEAPILLTNGKDDNVAELHAYIKENVNANGTVYILGGSAAVPETVEAIEGYTVKRLAGASRYDTNLEILAEAGITGTELIVATGKEFADSLSASATGRPILLVKPGAALSAEQKAIAETVKGGNIYVVGGTGAVAETTAAELESYATVERIAGAGRQETSKKIAEKFFADAKSVVAANAKNFPDGLCGGPLAAAMNAPLLLTATGNTAIAEGYVQGNGLASGVVLGGTGALSDEAVVDVFALESAEEIVLK